MSGFELKSIAQEEEDEQNNLLIGQKVPSTAAANRVQQDREVASLPEVVLVSPGRNQLSSSGQPIDKYRLVFIILLIHGIGTLMPWNMFINAGDYFKDYKLANSMASGARDRTDEELTEMRKNFMSYLSFAAQLPNVFFNGLNLVVNLGSGNLKLRVNLALVIEAAIFVLTIVLAVVNSYQWPGTFFNVTMISVVLLNMASGVYQNCVFGIGAKFPGKYTNAILIGSNLSGTFTSTVLLLSIWLAPLPQEAAMYYFATALFVILICLISYNLIDLNPFFRYYDRAGALQNNGTTTTTATLEIATADSASLKGIREEGANKTEPPLNGSTGSDNNNAAKNNISSDIPEALRKTVDAMVPRPSETRPDGRAHSDGSFKGELMNKWFIFKKCWPQCLNVFLTFYITLALFPAVMSSIGETGTFFGKKYYTPFACFFVFNLFAMIGNLISGLTTWPGRENVWILVAARVLFIPFFLFCNFNPLTRHWPVLIRSDLAFILGNILLALSSGYLSSLCMMFASSNLKPDEAPKGGMLAAFFLVLGIFVGVNSSFILTWIVEIG